MKCYIPSYFKVVIQNHHDTPLKVQTTFLKDQIYMSQNSDYKVPTNLH